MGYIGAGPTRFNTADDLTVTGDAEFNGNLTVKGTTTTIDSVTVQNFDMGDNDRIRIGDSQDLQIYHDGSNSIIAEASTGSLKIQGSDLYLTDDDGTNMLYAANNGGVTLYNGGAAKLATTATGVDVTGSVTADGVTSSAAIASQTGGSNSAPAIAITSGSLGVNGITAPAANTLGFVTGTGERLRIDASGNAFMKTANSYIAGTTSLGFYGDAASSNGMFIDSSGNVGIGTTSPTAGFRASIKGDYSSIIGGIEFDSGGGDKFTIGHASATSPSGTLNVVQSANMIFKTTNTERMRIDASGNVGIGTDSPATKLHVATVANTGLLVSSTDGTTLKGIVFNTNDNQFTVGTQTNHPVAFFSNNAEVVRVQTGGLTFTPATSNLYTVSGTLSYYGTTNNVYLNGASSGGMIMSGNGNRNQYIYLNSVSDSVSITTNTLERLGIDSSGRVTMPYQPAFQVTLSSSQSIASSTRTKIAFDSIDYQNGSNYSTANRRFTAPVTGWYQFNCWAYAYTVSSCEITLWKNGSLYLRSQNSAASAINNVNGQLSVVTKLTANDYVEMYASFTGAGDLYHSGEKPTVWSGILIG